MMRSFFFALAATLVAVGCTKTANITLNDEVTSRGLINKPQMSIGQVYLWDRPGKSAVRLLTINVPDSELSGKNRNPLDIVTKFERGIEISANANLARVLDSELEADLKNEASNRTKLVTKQARRVELSNPVDALVNYIKSDPDKWYDTMATAGVSAENEYQLAEGKYLVLVSEEVRGTALDLEVDTTNVTSSGFSFASKIDSDIEFKISDVGSVVFESKAPTALLVNVVAYKTNAKPKGMGFSLRDDKELLADLLVALSRR